MSLQVPYQKQLLELSSKISSQTHNLTAFKRRKSLQPHTSTRKLLQHTLPTEDSKAGSKNSNYIMKMHKSSSADKPPLIPERYIKRIVPSKRKKSHVTDYNKTNYTQHFITRINTLPPQQPHTEATLDKETVHIEKMDRQSSSSQRVLPLSGPAEREESVLNRKGLKEGHLESWINQVLTERCPDYKFDKNISNAAIKKFEIDKNSLISYGVSDENISRIFKSIYVYSMGFNNFISEVSRQCAVKKNLWKVFSILVEYCSQGTIEMIVSQVQRESKAEQQALRQQIENQQAVIDNNNQLNRHQNERIYRENSELKAKNEQLQLDRSMLKQSNEQNERAFTEEVSLRLMFENKISELHRLYRQLEIKHHKLFSDFNLKLNELTYFKDKATYYHDENVLLRKQKTALESDLCERAHQLSQSKETVAKLNQEISQYLMGDVQRMMERRINEGVMKQREVKEVQLAGQLKTVEMSLNNQQKKHESLKEEYYRSLDQNNRLITKLSEEVANITQRLLQQQQDNCSNSHFLSQIHSLQLKGEQKLALLNQMELTLKANFDTIEQLQLQLQTGKALNDSLQADLEASHQIIANLRRVHNELEEAFGDALKANQNHEKQAKELSRKIELQRERAEQWKSMYEQTRFQLQKSHSQAKVLKQQIPKLESRIEASIDEGEQNLRAEKSRWAQMESELNKNRLLAEKAREAFDGMESKYRSEKFVRDSLEYQYKHTLSLIENLQDVVKNQNSKISQFQRNIEELALSNKITKVQKSRLDKKLQVEREQAAKKRAELEERVRLKHGYTHPMIMEDVLEHQRRLQQEVYELNQSLSIQKEENQQQKFAYEQKMARVEHHQQTSCNQLLQQIRLRQLQIQYEHSKQKDFTQRIEYLQLTLKAKEHFEQTQPHNDAYKEKEKRYLEIISQNYFKIKTLTEDLETIQDHNNEMLTRLQFTEKQLKKRQEVIASMEREKEELKQANVQLAQEKDQFEVARKQLIQEINDRQSLLSSYVPDYKILKQSASQKLKKSRQKPPLPSKHNTSSMKRKVSLMEPVITQIKEREQREEDRQQRKPEGKHSQKSSYANEDWRLDFSNKLRSSFGYYK